MGFDHLVDCGCLLWFRGVSYKLLLLMIKEDTKQMRSDSGIPFILPSFMFLFFLLLSFFFSYLVFGKEGGYGMKKG